MVDSCDAPEEWRGCAPEKWCNLAMHHCLCGQLLTTYSNATEVAK